MLHNETEIFEQLILRTSEYLNIKPEIIEKDYFVTVFLKKLVEKMPEIKFKGGTSLSKCYGLIERFSENIDLNMLAETKPSESPLKSTCYASNREKKAQCQMLQRSGRSRY